MSLPLDHTQGVSPGQAHPERRRRRQRLGPRPDRRGDLPLEDLEELADPRMEDDSQDGADHVDAHRIPAHGHQPLHAEGRGRPRPLRPALVPPHDGEDHRDEAAQPRRAPGRAALRRHDAEAAERRALQRDQAQGQRDGDQPQHGRQPARVEGPARSTRSTRCPSSGWTRSSGDTSTGRTRRRLRPGRTRRRRTPRSGISQATRRSAIPAGSPRSCAARSATRTAAGTRAGLRAEMFSRM